MAEFTYDAPEPEESLPKMETRYNPDDDLAKWKLFVDGSSNQQGCDVGLVFQTPSGEQMEYAICMGFKATNNEAKYKALLAGLRVVMNLRVDSLDAFSDSQLVVNQV